MKTLGSFVTGWNHIEDCLIQGLLTLHGNNLTHTSSASTHTLDTQVTSYSKSTDRTVISNYERSIEILKNGIPSLLQILCVVITFHTVTRLGSVGFLGRGDPPLSHCSYTSGYDSSETTETYHFPTVVWRERTWLRSGPLHVRTIFTWNIKTPSYVTKHKRLSST